MNFYEVQGKFYSEDILNHYINQEIFTLLDRVMRGTKGTAHNRVRNLIHPGIGKALWQRAFKRCEVEAVGISREDLPQEHKIFKLKKNYLDNTLNGSILV
jgi:hypothetical protein